MSDDRWHDYDCNQCKDDLVHVSDKYLYYIAKSIEKSKKQAFVSKPLLSHYQALSHYHYQLDNGLEPKACFF